MNKELTCELCGKGDHTSHYVCKRCGLWVCHSCINTDHRICVSCVSVAILKDTSDD